MSVYCMSGCTLFKAILIINTADSYGRVGICSLAFKECVMNTDIASVDSVLQSSPLQCNLSDTLRRAPFFHILI